MRITTSAVAKAMTVASTAPMIAARPLLASSDHSRRNGVGGW